MSKIDSDGELYWKAVEPIWQVVDIYAEVDDFLGTFGLVAEAQGHGSFLQRHLTGLSMSKATIDVYNNPDISAGSLRR